MQKIDDFFLLLFSSSRPFIYIAQFFFIETDNTLVRSLCCYAVVTHFKTLFSASFFEVAFFSFTTKTILLEMLTTILSYELQFLSSSLSLSLVFYLFIYFDCDQSSPPERLWRINGHLQKSIPILIILYTLSLVQLANSEYSRYTLASSV